MAFGHILEKANCAVRTRDKRKQKEKQVTQISQKDCAAGCVSMAKSERLELGDNIYGQYRSIFNHCDVFGQQRNQNLRKKRKIRAITPFKVIQGHRGRYHSKAPMRLTSLINSN